MRSIALIFSALSLASVVAGQADTNTTHLTATALVTKNNNSAFECWQLTEPFRRSSVPGVSGTQVATISNNTNFAYSILPPRYDGGIHTAPTPQIVHFLSGIAHVTLPHNATVDAWILGGVGGLLFAVDTTGTGHITRYPSDQETVAITAPFAEGKIPAHTVLADGPCVGRQTFVKTPQNGAIPPNISIGKGQTQVPIDRRRVSSIAGSTGLWPCAFLPTTNESCFPHCQAQSCGGFHHPPAYASLHTPHRSIS